MKFFVFFLLSFYFSFVIEPSHVAYSGTYASVVMDAASGKVFHEVNADKEVYPASLTKMMTLYLTFQALAQNKLRLEQLLPVSAHAQRQGPSKLGLKKGERITVKDAVLALVTKSANDASVVLAEALKGSEQQFAILMTQTARKIGLYQTRFQNASGLPNPHQKTTAKDMAILGRALWKHFPVYYNYFKSPSFQFRGVTHKNHNRLLGKVSGVDGIKTGWINASGFNLAASVLRNNRRLIVVVMGGETPKWRDSHMTQLINTAYQAPHKLPIVTAGLYRNKKSGSPLGIPSLISQAYANPTKQTRRASIETLIASRKSVKKQKMKKKKGSLKKLKNKRKSFRKV